MPYRTIYKFPKKKGCWLFHDWNLQIKQERRNEIKNNLKTSLESGRQLIVRIHVFDDFELVCEKCCLTKATPINSYYLNLTSEEWNKQWELIKNECRKK